MSAVTSVVLLRQPFHEYLTGTVDELLRTFATDVRGSRKGRYWEFVLTGYQVTLLVTPTTKHPEQFQDDLLDNDLLFEDAPEAVVLRCPTGGRNIRYFFLCLADVIAEELSGIPLGLRDDFSKSQAFRSSRQPKVTRVGVEPKDASLSNWSLCQFAYPADERVQGSWFSGSTVDVSARLSSSLTSDLSSLTSHEVAGPGVAPGGPGL